VGTGREPAVAPGADGAARHDQEVASGYDDEYEDGEEGTWDVAAAIADDDGR
jgi:hypothetical protein